MAVQETEYEILECKIAKLQEEHRGTLDALQNLFDLLEAYAPMWYTEEHHRQAVSALRCTSEPCL